MESIIDDLTHISRRCKRAASRTETEEFTNLGVRLVTAIDKFEAASSGSWLGYQAMVYTKDFTPKRPGDHFDSEWGPLSRSLSTLNSTRGEWAEYDRSDVNDAILSHAGASEEELESLATTATSVEQIFRECKIEVLATLDAALRDAPDPVLQEQRKRVSALDSRFSQQNLIETMMPKGQMLVRDSRAQQGGISVPPHHARRAWLASNRSVASQALSLAESIDYTATYLQKARKMKGNTVARTDGPVFIGHGRSRVWKDLKDFLFERLKIEHEEFNRESTAGRSNKERLLEMLDRCPFAFLVLTAEDEQADGKVHARANVIHEAGLFQGRYGFERAIVLLEEGCEEFSNINGIGQIRFRQDDFNSVSEEIRRVLEREKII